MGKNIYFVVLLLFFFIAGFSGHAKAEGSGVNGVDRSVLSTLRPGHPRLMLTAGREKEILRLKGEDAYFSKIVDIILRQADVYLGEPVIEYKKVGRRLLSQTRRSFSRIAHLCMAYRLSGEKRYLDRVEKEMLAASSLEDWNPSHFLDVAEMAAGMAIGYDWLYNDLSESTRKQLRESLIEKALKPGLEEPQGWVKKENNWNQVCHTGLAMAGLAMAEDEPEWARRAVERALEYVPCAMKALYEPEGVYPEGPSYWVYGTTYNVLLIDSLMSALGQDFGLSGQRGFLQSAYYSNQVVAPDGHFFRYSDCVFSRPLIPCLYWFARYYNKPDLAAMVRIGEEGIIESFGSRRSSNGGQFFPFQALWYMAASARAIYSLLPLDYMGNGRNPIAVFRSEWGSPEALFLAIKGGDNTLGHSHMDAGTFMIMAGGVRWSDDLGMDSYTNLEEIVTSVSSKKPSRHNFFRLGVQGHSTLMLGGSGQEISDSVSPIACFYSSPNRSHAIVEMSKVWRKQADKVLRGAAMLDKRSVLIQDEITGAKGEILWQMITVEDIALSGDTAVMRQGGKRFIAKIHLPKGAVFERLSATPVHSLESQNEGYAKLAIRIGSPSEDETIAVQMYLDDVDGGLLPETIGLQPLSKW